MQQQRPTLLLPIVYSSVYQNCIWEEGTQDSSPVSPRQVRLATSYKSDVMGVRSIAAGFSTTSPLFDPG